MCAKPSGADVHDHRGSDRSGGPCGSCPRRRCERLLVERVEQRGAVDVDVTELACVDVLDRPAARAAAAPPWPPRDSVPRPPARSRRRCAPPPWPPPLLRPRPPRRRRRFLGCAVGPGRAAVVGVALPGRPSPSGRPRAPGGCRRSAAAAAGGRARPASSRACSPMSSSVSRGRRLRRSSPRCPRMRLAGRRRSSVVIVVVGASSARRAAVGRAAGTAPPRRPASCGLRRRGVPRRRFLRGACRRARRRRSGRASPDARRLRRARCGASLQCVRRSARDAPASADARRRVGVHRGSPCVSSSRRFRSDIDAFSHDAHPAAHAGACRRRAAPAARRRARSIGVYAALETSVKSPMAASDLARLRATRLG